MAFEYQNFASLGVNLNRQKYGPLDISNVFTSEADLKYYLSKGTFTEGVSEYWTKVVPYPYEGQVLATVINGVVSVYALSLDAEGNFQTQEIGAKVEVDGKTIKLNADGKLELVGIPTEVSGKTYVPSLVNGELVWAEPDTSTAEGQQQAIEGLDGRLGSVEKVLNGSGEGEERVKGLVEKVADLEAVDNATQAELDAYKEVVTGAIAEALQSAKDYADQNDADTVYNDSELRGRIEAIEGDYLKEADKYDDTELAGRVAAIEGDYLKAEDKYDDSVLAGKVSALETAVGNAESGLVKSVADNAQAIIDAEGRVKDYTDEEIAGLKVGIEQKEGIEYIVVKGKNGEEITSVNASKFVQDSFLNDVSYDPQTGKVSFVWTMGDGSTKTDEIDIAHLVDTYTAGSGLKVENNEFSIDTEVVATVSALNEVKGLAEAAQTQEQVASAISTAITGANLGQYAVKSEVETELGKKLDKSVYDQHVSDYLADKATYALKSDVESGLAGKVDNSVLEGYYTKTEIDDKGYAVASEVESTYATKAMLEEHEGNIADELLNYAKSSEVNAELAKKIEGGSIAHSTDELAEGVTVEGNQLKIIVDAYTKAETLAQIEEILDQINDNSESAASVNTKLENHIKTYEEKVGQIDTKDASQDTAIAAAQAQADKGVADAAQVAADLVTANGLIADNTREIGVVKGSITNVNETLGGKITALETAKGEQAAQISGIDGRLTTAESSIATNSSDINTIKGQITALDNEDTRLAGLIEGLGTSKANAVDVYTKGEADTAIGNAIDAKLVDVNAAIAGKADANDVEEALDLKANVADVYAKADVYTKDEADAAFLTEGEVDARINALILAADPEGGKTISDIQNLVKYVDENAGEIAALITATEANTNKLAGIDGTVTGYVADELAKLIQPKASEEVSVGADGTLGIIGVSTDKLVQGNDTLVLNGGSAN